MAIFASRSRRRIMLHYIAVQDPSTKREDRLLKPFDTVEVDISNGTAGILTELVARCRAFVLTIFSCMTLLLKRLAVLTRISCFEFRLTTGRHKTRIQRCHRHPG